MSNGVKKSKDAKKKSMVQISFIAAAVKEGGEILNGMPNGSILEYDIHEAELSIKLENNGIDKDGNRFDPDTKYVISIKGNPEKPKTNKKAKLPTKVKEDDDLTH